MDSPNDDRGPMRYVAVAIKFCKYFRLWTFRFLMKPISRSSRKRRMKEFADTIEVRPMDKVLDLGGHPDIWEYVEVPLNITILNLPGNVVQRQIGKHEFIFVEGNACDVTQFECGDFDVVYSNSVIEHVGPEPMQKAFAAQVRKFNTKYWIQTPSKWFPIEAHCGMPFWWFYPDTLREWTLAKWRKKLPAWTQMVENTRVLERRSLERLFPGSKIYTERKFGWPKSYVVFNTYQ